LPKYWWIAVLVGGIVVLAIAAYIIFWRRKKLRNVGAIKGVTTEELAGNSKDGASDAGCIAAKENEKQSDV
jgi:hypothetical protein